MKSSRVVPIVTQACSSAQSRCAHSTAFLCIGLAFICIAAYILHACGVMPVYSFCHGAPFSSFLLFHFSHVNVFHLACNMVALLSFKPRALTCVVAFIASTLAALLLSVSTACAPACGLSAFLFAAVARRAVVWHRMPWKLLLANVVFIFVPSVAWMVHYVSFFIAYVLWQLMYATVMRKR